MTREEYINELNRHKIEVQHDFGWNTTLIEALDMAAIQALEQTRWIPVSVRLPEDRKLVLVTAFWHEKYQVMVGSYFGNDEWWCVPWNNTSEPQQLLKTIAWMPLPEPYKAESEE